MNKLFKIHWLAALCGLTMLSLTACNDDDNPENKSPEVNPDINVNVETYAGGELGTTFNNSASAYEDPTPATENAGMSDKFKYGEYFFERSYTQNSKPFNGLGQETGCANGKLPKSECRITLFGRKNQSVCRSVVLT